MPPPLFVSFEGGEGSGKTTQAGLLHQRLKERQVNVILVHEPGSTPLGKALRNFLLSQKLVPQAELLLFLAARAQLVQQVLRPALRQGVSVVADRYADSSVAYQGYGRRLPLEMVRQLNRFATGGLVPDMTVLLDMPPEEGLRRMGQEQTLEQLPMEIKDVGLPEGRVDAKGQRKFERLPLAFHQRVRNGFLALAKAEPGRFLVLDATLPRDELARRIWERVAPLLEEAGQASSP
ncbi:MAG: dTMP kinase [Chloroflexi bacterium]|nr:dTMP kinase [Chloroflexota bacterium]